VQQKFIIMSIVKLEGKYRTVKVASTKVLPCKEKEPVRAGSDSKN